MSGMLGVLGCPRGFWLTVVTLRSADGKSWEDPVRERCRRSRRTALPLPAHRLSPGLPHATQDKRG